MLSAVSEIYSTVFSPLSCIKGFSNFLHFFVCTFFFVSLSLIKHVFGLQVYFLQYCFLISTPAMLLYVCQYDWVQLCFSRITAEEQNIVCLSETTSVFICVQMEERLQHVVVFHMLHSNQIVGWETVCKRKPLEREREDNERESGRGQTVSDNEER